MNSNFGGLDLRYSYVPSSDSYYPKIITDIAATRAEVLEDPAVISIIVRTQFTSSIEYILTSVYLGSTLIDTSTVKMGTHSLDKVNVRIFFFNTYMAVTVNGKWVYFYGFGTISYPSPISVKLHAVSGGTVQYTDIVKRELSDGRTAIFVDYESNGDAALSSIIQQRPVQVFPGINRELEFTYQAVKDTVEIKYPLEYTENRADNGQLSSDGLTYYRDVGISISEDTARDVGFVTKLYRLSELDNGAIEATGIIQKTALQRRNMIPITGRFDPRLQITDELVIDRIASSTGRHIEDDIIVEDISVNLSNGSYLCQITGRRK